MDPKTEPRAPGSDPVDALVVAVLERLTAGEVGALEDLCAAHPERADEVRARVAALGEMNLLPSDAAAMAFPERLGEFRLVRRLGGGGMGVVYEAVQESLGRTVALKLIRPEHLYFARSRERFRRETDAVARLAHPGIVSIYTVGEAQGTPYFAMEMIHGATLAQVLEQVAGLAPESLLGEDLRAAVVAMAPDEASSATESASELFSGTWAQVCTRVILRMADALAHAHGRGVLHRDIKPSNIAVTPGGRVVLLDFGLAGLETELRMTASGSALGSVLYMAPEQLAGRLDEVDARTDVYALGITLYEMLALQPPFAGADSQQTRAAILDGTPAPLRARHRNVPRDLELVCLKAIEHERSRRYASMEAFGADLRSVLEGLPVQARPPSAAYRVRRWMTRHPASSTAIALSALLVTILPTALYLQQRASSAALERALTAETAARARADAESQRASAAARESEAAANFLVEMFGAADPYTAGRRGLTAGDLLDRGFHRVEDELADQPELQANLFERIGMSYTNLDRYKEALVPLDRALELRLRLHGERDLRTASSMVLVASAARLAGRPGAADLVRRAGAIAEADPQADPAALINVRVLLAGCQLDAGESEEPLQLLEEARRRLDDLPEERRDMRWMVLAMLASANQHVGHYAEAEQLARETLALDREVALTTNPYRCAALHTLGLALCSQGRIEEACATYDALIPEARAFYAPDNVVLTQMELDHAIARQALGHREGIADEMLRALTGLRREYGARHSRTLGALTFTIQALLREGRFDEATALNSELRDELRGSTGEDAGRLAVLDYMDGLTELARGENARAVEALRRACEDVDPGDPVSRTSFEGTLACALLDDPARRSEAEAIARRQLATDTGDGQVVARYVLARLALDEERTSDAEALLGPATPRVRSADVRLWAEAACDALRAEVLIRNDDVERGHARYEAALAALEDSLGPFHAELRELRARLARLDASR